MSLGAGRPSLGQSEPPALGNPASEWRRLRALQGHFDGQPWRDEVDRWQGPKHRLMQQMAEQLMAQRADPRAVQALLGRPDHLLKPGQAAHTRLLQQWPGEPGESIDGAELWLYRWRASHDQLLLIVKHGRLTATRWLYERE